MRKACKLLNVGVTRLESEIVKEPFFDHVIGAAAEKIAFRYLAGLIHRCTEGFGGKMISEEVGFELDKNKFAALNNKANSAGKRK